MEKIEVKKKTKYIWEIPKQGGMKVPCVIFGTDSMVKKMQEDGTLQQGKNMAHLPGIHKKACIMPDGHRGYGFPIGGVAALDFEKGGISPGGIGYDINCGVRLLRTNLNKDDVKEKINELLEKLFEACPPGVGSSNIRVDNEQLKLILNNGAKWAVDNGYGNKDDLVHCEENGCMKQADANTVSEQAMKRGKKQVATLGSGNHFLELQYVDQIYDKEAAKAFGITKKGQVTIMIHCGSRGLGHQVCSDYLRKMEKAYPDIIKSLPDRELIYAPAGSELAEQYLKAMAAAANYAWCNRHILGHQTRKAILETFKDAEVKTIYDVAHNICKIENHIIDNKKTKVYMHRKGATRAFGPDSKDIPKDYQGIGQPILIPGSMGTASYLLKGTKESEELSFSSTAHGAGRVMSRHAALKEFRGEAIAKEMHAKGIEVKGSSWKGIAEEASGAYKDIDEVIEISDKTGIGKKVARLIPIGVIKG